LFASPTTGVGQGKGLGIDNLVDFNEAGFLLAGGQRFGFWESRQYWACQFGQYCASGCCTSPLLHVSSISDRL
jgi:hypothetical protein